MLTKSVETGPKTRLETCPGYHEHLNNRNQKATQQALKEAEGEKEKRNTPVKMKKSTSQNLTIKQQLIPRHKTVNNKYSHNPETKQQKNTKKTTQWAKENLKTHLHKNDAW